MVILMDIHVASIGEGITIIRLVLVVVNGVVAGDDGVIRMIS